MTKKILIKKYQNSEYSTKSNFLIKQ